MSQSIIVSVNIDGSNLRLESTVATLFPQLLHEIVAVYLPNDSLPNKLL